MIEFYISFICFIIWAYSFFTMFNKLWENKNFNLCLLVIIMSISCSLSISFFTIGLLKINN